MLIGAKRTSLINGMLLNEIKNIPQSKKGLRSFGLGIGGAFIIGAGTLVWSGSVLWVLGGALGALFIIFGLLAPHVLQSLHKVWMTLSIIIGWCMTRVILLVLFFMIMLPLGMVARLFRKKFLDLNFYSDRTSYWIKRTTTPLGREKYERQF